MLDSSGELVEMVPPNFTIELNDVMDSLSSNDSGKNRKPTCTNKLETTVYVLFGFLLGMLLTHIILHSF